MDNFRQTLQKALKSHNHLRVPVNENIFLVSPPGSPPLGWTQDYEDAPAPHIKISLETGPNVPKIQIN